MTEKKEISRNAYMAIEKEKINKMNKKEKDKMIQNAKQICESNVNVSTGVVTNNDALPKELVSILPISQPTHNIQSSRATLYEVKKRLRSLHNVLRTYQDMSRTSERQESIDKINKIDALASIEKTDKNEIDVNCNNNTKENLQQIDCSTVNSCEYFECNRSKESSSSLVEYSSNMSEDVTLQNEDIIKTTLFNSTKKIPEIESREICYISSSESFEDLNIQIQSKTCLIENFTTKKCSDIFDGKQCQQNTIISQNSSQNKISNDSNREEKSTTLLLQEALHFKKALLTRIQSRKECPINSIKEDDVRKEFLSELNNNNFPSIIVDIEIKESITSDSHDKINQCYIYLEMKQRYDLFPEYLQKANAFAHRKSKRDIENQNRISEKSSQYFSISNLTIPNNKDESDVSSKSPVYEKVLSIVIPVSIEHQSEIDINEKLMQTKTVLGNTIQACVNPRENFTKNTDNIGDKDKHSFTMLKFEDLILEHIKSIRDYIDNFLRNQNKAISKARKALQCQDKRYLNETSHIVLHNRLTPSSNCNSTDQVIDSSLNNSSNLLNNSLNNSSNLLIHTGPNYKQISIKDNILKCYSDMCLRKNPGILMPTTPIKFSNKNNTQHSMAIELKRRETDLFHPVTLKYYCKNRSKSTHNWDFDMPYCEKYIMTDMENDKINKKKIIDISANLQKRKKQIQDVKNKSSVILYVPFATTDAKIVETMR